MSKEITSRKADYSQWYNDLIIKGQLADYSAVKGCMVIKPLGYALWENMRDVLDKKFKDTGHVNAYFPLFVPKSLFEAEEKNAEGFAKECAVVTHYRLKNDPNNAGKLIVDPEAKLEEELVVRPTSEAIIWNTYKTWIQSYRDLPLLINQWANVVRWEMRTRLFLRTTEEAIAETKQMIDVYAHFAEHYMAMPVIRGVKSANERFAGAVDTYTIEALMQDGKALQAGTSHFLGQNFAKAFDVTFVNKENKAEHVWATSWGVSTRLIGALVMAHSDDDGLIFPPRLAPMQVVIVPIYKGDEQKAMIDEKVNALMANLKSAGIRAKYDDNDNVRPGFKFAEYEMKGVPVRVTFGARDLENNLVEIARRDTKEKTSISVDGLSEAIIAMLDDVQNNMFAKAKAHQQANITKVNTWDEFVNTLETKGGFISAHWDGTPESEEEIKTKTKATIRCIPLDNEPEDGVCILSGKPSKERVLFAKAY
jgi:prolyl-tRNA synthetase